jgi:hemolysin III
MDYGEKFNAVTHLVGAALALIGTVVLIVLAALDGDPWKVVSVSIYGTTLVLLYVAFAMHRLNHRPRKYLVFKTPHEVFMKQLHSRHHAVALQS